MSNDERGLFGLCKRVNVTSVGVTQLPVGDVCYRALIDQNQKSILFKWLSMQLTTCPWFRGLVWSWVSFAFRAAKTGTGSMAWIRIRRKLASCNA